MIRTQQIKDFQREQVEPFLQELIQELDRNFRQRKSHLAAEMKQQLCDVLMSQHIRKKEGTIAFVVISWLRSSYLFEGILAYDLQAYDSSWYYDAARAQKSFNFSWLETYLKRFSEGLKEMISQQATPALQGQEDYYVKCYFDVFHTYFTELMRYVWKTAEEELLQLMTTDERFYVFVGEYKDESVPVLQQVPRLAQYEFQDLWDNQLLDVEEYKNLEHLNLTELDFSSQALVSVSFEHANLLNSNLSDCLLVNSRFEHACLDGATFNRAKLQDATFVSASCVGTSFRAAVAAQASLLDVLPCYFGVDFTNANLEKADFRGANLAGACFKNANLQGAQFYATEKERLILSEQQQQEIDWVTE